MTSDSPPDWPRTAPPPASGVLRAAPEDFIVDEILTIELSGSGEHVWLKVRKRGWTTDRVAQQLARVAGVSRRDVGYAGMKDRHAVTTQWFSVQLPGRDAPAWAEALPSGIEVLESVRHARKLQTGALAGNRFDITLRVCTGDRALLTARVEALRIRGVPNYFGEQRFGHHGANVERARAMFAGKLRTRDRALRGIYLSAARSYLFNEVLAQRVRADNWDTGLDGEVFLLDGKHSYFIADHIDALLNERLLRHDIHPSGPLWGQGEALPKASVRQMEDEVLACHADLAAGLAAAGLRQERRALRLFPRDLAADWTDATSLRIGFQLPPGSYATVVLRELVDYRVATAMVDED
jgi:tRNA pseudouridine13 synthase